MNWILTAVLCAVLVELALRLPFARAVGGILGAARKASRVVRAKASDHWKEKAMGAYARRTFAATGLLAVLLALVFGVAAVLVVIFDRLAPGFAAFILGWSGILASLVLATAWFYARRAITRGL